MLTSTLEHIIVKYLNNQASASEQETLNLWLAEDDAHLEIFKDYVKTKHLIDFNYLMVDTEKSKRQLQTFISEEKKAVKMKTYYRVASYAAIAVLFLAIGFLFKDELGVNNNKQPNNQTIVNKTIIKSGTDKATLTLEDGTEVVLDKGTSYHTAFAESDGEALVYQNEQQPLETMVYNVLTVPRGGQFFVQLSDGTKVWLNSDSQLKYPRNFIDNKPRNVELVYGEAYFEVSPSTAHHGMAFQVDSKNQVIEVLGTQFNIKAYPDEKATYTTLVEGKIVVETNYSKEMLKPNQQAVLSDDTNLMTIKTIEVYNEISWKDGVFSFKGKPLAEIMTVLSRWYDVNVNFENKDLEDDLFGGSFSKDQKLTDILEMVQNTTSAMYEILDKTIVIK